jgi:fengycin family lipopeptide synthetase B
MIAVQDNRRTSGTFDMSQHAYWLKRLAGTLPEPAWLLGEAKPAREGHASRHHTFEFPEEPRLALQRASKGSDLSAFIILVAVLKVVLYKYSGEDDILILSPAYRPGPCGVHGDLVPLRVNLNSGGSFKDLLALVKQAVVEAYSNQDITLAEIAKAIGLPESDGPAISNITVLHERLHGPRAATCKPGELTFTFRATESRLSCEMTFDAGSFTGEAMERLGSQYVTALSNALGRINQAITSLSILTPAERDVYAAMNQTAQSLPNELSVAQWFEQQAAATPDRIAVVSEEDAISYSRLNKRASQIGSRLSSLGAGLESVIAICADRDIDYIATILGVFKIGAAYLPLDHAHPSSRIAQMIASSGSRVVVASDLYRRTIQEVIDSLTGTDRPTVVFLEDILAGASARPTIPLEECTAHLSYVLYTSGSTGRPKGAMIEMAGMRNHLFAKIDSLGLAAEDVVAQNASQCFDISVWQFLAPLLVGGTVQIISDLRVRDVDALLEEISLNGVTVLELVPSQLRAILDAVALAGSSRLKTLRSLVVTGEALPPDLCRRWSALFKNTPIVNAWGPTEASDDVTHYHVTDIPSDALSVPIGRTVPNTAAYALDRDLSQAPLQVAGEIYVGGICVGRGYIGEPERTAAAFVPDHLSGLLGARLYKTGDLGRCAADGNIDFLGRIDHQVKVRGYRIELGEIQAALTQHKQIVDVAVLAREDQPGEKRLVAYAVLTPGASLSVTGARDFLKHKLPDYMAPSAVVVLPALPRTSNGKLDRKNLPAPDSVRTDLAGRFVAPESQVEESLAEIWSRVLGVPAVGVTDNFFELGGDSILCIQVVGKCRRAGLSIAPHQIFQLQTIRELARVVGASKAATTDQGPITGAIPLTPIQRWFFELDFQNRNIHNQAVTLEAGSRLDPTLLRRAIAGVLLHHDALRLSFSNSSGRWTQTNLPPDESVPFSVVDLSDWPPAEQEQKAKAIVAELHNSLSLESGRVFTSALFDFGPGQKNIVLLVAHHLTVDGVSWRIVQEDLETAYRQLADGGHVALPAKTTSYKQWAERLVDRAHSPEAEKELEYWSEAARHKYSDRLPVDRPGGSDTIASTRTITVGLDSDETSILSHEVSQNHGAQMNEVLLAALQHVICAWTGHRRVLVDLESHGRVALSEDIDLTRTVGWFTAIYPVLLEGTPDQPPSHAVRSVKKQMRRVPKDGIGFGLLRYLNTNSGIAAELRQLPAADVNFNYLGQFNPAKSSEDLLTWQSISIASDNERSRGYMLDVGGFVSAGRLQLTFGYSSNLHETTTIELLAQNYMTFLRSLIDKARRANHQTSTVSSFPEANLSDEQLAEVISFLK